VNGNKKIFLLLLLAALFLWLTTAVALANNQLAGSQVNIKVKPGFNGVYKTSALVPLQVTIENKGGDISGYLMLATDQERLPHDQVGYIKEIFVAAGATEIIEFLLPGNVVAERNQVNLMVQDKLVAWAPIQGLMVRGDGILILGVSTRGELYKTLLGAQDKSGGFSRLMTGKTIQPSDLPGDFFTLQGADLIFIDEEAQSGLTSTQKEALEKWILAGGILILSPGADGLADGHPAPGSMLAANKGQPLFYRQSLGQGAIITSTYDLLSQSGLDKEDEGQLWRDIMHGEQFYHGYNYDGFWGSSWNYLDAANWFEHIQAPSLVVFGGILGSYLLLAGPVMYLILRRLDKRDWAWLAVPVTAIILAGGIMGAGNARIPGDGALQTVSAINIAGKGTAVADGAMAAIIPRGGEYSFAIPTNTYAIPAVQGRTAGDMTVLMKEGGAKTVAFNQVEFWSVRNIVFQRLVTHLGQIDGELTLQEELLAGTLINNTGLDLKDVLVTVGLKTISIGEWPTGERIVLSESLDWEQGGYNPAWGRNLTPQQERLFHGGGKPVAAREVYPGPQPAVAVKYGSYYPTARAGLIVRVTGWTDADLHFGEVSGLQLSGRSLHLVTQNLTVDLGGEDRVFYPWGMIPPNYLSSVEYNYFAHNQSGLVLQGSIQADFHIGTNIKVERLNNNFYHYPAAQATGAVYNWQTKEWDKLKDTDLRTITQENIAPYLSDEGKLRVRFISDKGGREIIPEPAIQVLGRVSR
jgi:hypothetical protein